ncbi:Na(+)-translocating NADH-quinone reductase subunit A [Mesobacterium pallidum]|uniref:Na(+)-translocating NADH-quinone reductase subunit A n=1 Tax=Mesobacterium pallidum TaxID=2872037 RepID=UPI001EE280C7|nr:Na(+)-translocating NADH-quinone reductase subunit A [Mesobacterium pallidum]
MGTGPAGAGGSAHTETRITAEASIRSPFRGDFRVELLVAPGDVVAQGQPVLRATKAHAFTITAPMPAKVASIDMDRGQRLKSMLFYHEPGAGRHVFDVPDAMDGPVIWRLLANTGLWRAFRQRPGASPAFGDIRPAAILVMAHDTRPGAGRPLDWVRSRGAEIEAGLEALTRLTDGPVLMVRPRGAEVDQRHATGRVTLIDAPDVHPLGLAGPHVLRHAPASFDRPVWDIHIEAVADIGALIRTGMIPATKTVALTGPGMRTPLLQRVQAGADVRELLLGKVVPGNHLVLGGSAIDGAPARWVRWGSHQVTVLMAPPPEKPPHWLRAALSRTARPLPVIPTAGLDRALGGVVPVMPLIRAISAGDTETATALGALSLVEEDLALVDYLTGAEPRIARQLRALIDRAAVEEGVA